jgi:hypothetical protein
MTTALLSLILKTEELTPLFYMFFETYSTVTDFAKLRGLSTSVPRAHAVW